jgi:hypothetical protein
MIRASIVLLVSAVCIPNASAQQMMHSHAADPAITQSGQAAFAAIQEIVRLLDTDPNTDWSRVDIDGLRNHLVDMDEVVMRAHAESALFEGGVRITVVGTGTTLDAIQRMIPAQAAMMNGYRDWRTETVKRPDGIVWTIFTSSESERTRIRALGLFGLLALGSHHAVHHWEMARGQLTHK